MLKCLLWAFCGESGSWQTATLLQKALSHQPIFGEDIDISDRCLLISCNFDETNASNIEVSIWVTTTFQLLMASYGFGDIKQNKQI